jgi:flagellar protein FliS
MNAAVQRALGQYASTRTEAAISYADQHTLVAMLFNGLLDALLDIKISLINQDLAKKSQSISKAQGILLGLRSTLDFEQGGSIARDLAALYDYCLRGLISVQVRQDQDRLNELHSIVSQLHSAWHAIPAKVRTDFPS